MWIGILVYVVTVYAINHLCRQINTDIDNTIEANSATVCVSAHEYTLKAFCTNHDHVDVQLTCGRDNL